MSIKIVTDSTSDIPVNLREELGITVVPISLIIDGKEYRDGYDLNPRDFYPVLESMEKVPTHSQITSYTYFDIFKEAYLEGYTDLIYVTINSKGSSTYSNGIQAIEQFYHKNPDARDKIKIHLIDSHTYTMGYGWAVIEAARMAANGATVDEIIAMINDWLAHVRTMFVSLDLRFAKKSGRISAAAALVGDALGLKPVIVFENGESKILAKVRGEKKAVAGLMEIVQRERKPGSPYMLIHANNPVCSARLAEAVMQMDQPPEMDYDLGCVIAVNAGPNMIGIIYRT